jgi:SAM-dependent methyltransferase
MDTSVRLSPFARRIHEGCRAARWSRYARAFPPKEGEAILDVGVSPLVDLPGENHFLAMYPFPSQVTAISNDRNLEPVRGAFPAVRVLTADALALPFGDDTFDVVHSNAVIEHVGAAAAQARFLAELVRVGRSGFVSTPCRWFPVDSHTNLPVLHWLPRPAFLAALRRLRRLGPEEEWITWLLSARELRRLAPSGIELAVARQRLAGMTAVVTLLFRRGR